MSAEVNAQTGGDPVIDQLDFWSSVYVKKATTGRGSNGNISAYGIQKLRELILELAVRGRLVPQDPNDEPASALLEKIVEEREQLLKKGKTKKQKKLPGVGDELPHYLPENWEWARLGEVTNYGITEKAEPGDVDDKAWVLELGDVDKTTSNLLKRVRYSERPFRSSKNRFNVGDVLYGKLRPYLDKVLVADEVGVCTTEIIPIRGYTGIAPFYLRLLLKAPNFIIYANESTHGMNLPRLGTEKARLALIPLAPTAEQHRIVAKVDELMTLCDQLEKQQTDSLQTHQTLVETLLHTLVDASNAQSAQQAWNRIAEHFDTTFATEDSIDQLKQTILQLAVMGKLVPQDSNEESASVLLERIAEEKARLVKKGKIKKQKVLPVVGEDEIFFALPTGWEVSRLGVFTIVGTGATPARDNSEYYFPPEINWVTSGETGQEYIEDTNEKISPLAVKETNVSLYPIGSLIIAMYGQGKTRGQVSELMIEAGTNQACAVIILVNKDSAHRRYVKYFFKKAYEEIRSGAAGGAQPNLNVGKISNTAIPLPPLAEQCRIVAKVDELMALCDSLKVRIQDRQTTQTHLADAIVEQVVG